MNRYRTARPLAGLVVLLALAGAGACARASDPAPPPVSRVGAAPSGQIATGQALAQRHCGGCHAVTRSVSPLADAPPFRDLHLRYPPGGLATLLEQGMLPPDKPPEEGSRPSHPRMPSAVLGADEVAALTAYLRSLDPRP